MFCTCFVVIKANQSTRWGVISKLDKLAKIIITDKQWSIELIDVASEFRVHWLHSKLFIETMVEIC